MKARNNEENVSALLKRLRKWFKFLTKEQQHIFYKESKKAFEKMGIIPNPKK